MSKFGWFRRLQVLGLISAFVVSALAGCGGQKQAGEKAAGGQEITYTVADPTGDWGFPSPFAHYARGPGYIRMSFIFDTLVWKNDKEYVPALAKSWEYLKEENAYVFKLNDNVTWHDGKKFTARDVVFTVSYIKDHPYQWVDSSVIKKAEAAGDHEVRLYLERPYAPFLDYVACTLPILPEHVWKDVKNPEQFQQKEALIGTGPFTLADYSKDHGTYLYSAYEGYYQGRPKVAQLKFVKVSGEMSPAALRQKQVSAAQVPPELSGDLGKEGLKVLAGTNDWVAKLMINHRKEPFSNKQFRQALAYAVDRRALVETCLRGHGQPGSPGLVPPDSRWYNPAMQDRYPYSPEKAAELIGGLGYVKKGSYFEKDGKVLEVELLVSGGGIGVPGAPREREGEMIKAQLEKAGIKVNLRSLEAKTLDSRVGEWKFDLALSGHGGMGGDPEILNRVITGKGFNSARYQDSEEMNNALKQQLAALDTDRRGELVGGIQELYSEEMPSLPLYYPTWYWVHDGRVNLYYTLQGVGSGVPIPLNKMSFVK
ncbi:MAG: ABC transporter substrate-binding protein [Peptococcaceae bacterium]|nr:ABC transporter substrate-binding protein [Peptococcaceae bacterium]